jgi:prepilin-type N-terminal cleavage/methylation domain-containing protein
MRQNGFSLVELVVVIAILAILLSIATLQFNQYTKKSVIEGQVRTMYTDLMTVRSQALFEKRDRTVTVTATSFSVYSSSLATGTPVLQRTLKCRVISNNSMPYTVTFNSRGVIDGVDNASICAEPSDNPAAIDSLVLYTTRIQMGKRDAGADCSAANIKRK